MSIFLSCKKLILDTSLIEIYPFLLFSFLQTAFLLLNKNIHFFGVKMLSKSITYLILFAFTIYSLIGCSGSESIRSPYADQISYKDNEQFPVNRDELYSVCLFVLQEKGYIIKLSDPETGLINAEFNSTSLIKEDADESSEQDNTCVNIISIVLLVGIIFLIVSAVSSGSDNSDGGNECCSEDESFYTTETSASSYQYNLTLTIFFVNADTSVCSLVLIRSYIENGTVISQNSLMNKEFNYNFFNDIRNSLTF